MNQTLLQFVNFVKSLPASKKISIAAVVLLLAASFAAMFMMANQVEYRVLFNNLSPQDAGAVIARLKEKNVPYRIEGGGSLIMVPAEQVYELRLGLAGDGLLKDGQVGFEIFDKTDFKTTQFVQGLNYQRALQGELARTIGSFREVNNARVFIVLPKETLFVEDAKPASASILLDLKSSLPPERLAAIIHLTAGAVEGLDPEQVTVVDTKGRVIFKGGGKNETDALLSDTQLDYKAKIESEIGKNVQSMLEGIIGPGNAIVRVNADIDFDKINLNEEEYDPAAAVVRSKRDIEESSQAGNATPEMPASSVNQRTGIVPSGASVQNGKLKRESLTNYEINKVTRTVFKPAGTIKRLSVAAVIDGTYESEKGKDGAVTRKYIARTGEELKKFEDIVKSAMGYSEDREDRISVSSIPFSDAISVENMTEGAPGGVDFGTLYNNYGRIPLNLFIVAAVFFLVVRPLLNSLKNIPAQRPVSGPMELPAGVSHELRLPGADTQIRREKLLEISKGNPEKTEQLIKGWINE
jgi:flagellar M-ring protein FliF